MTARDVEDNFRKERTKGVFLSKFFYMRLEVLVCTVTYSLTLLHLIVYPKQNPVASLGSKGFVHGDDFYFSSSSYHKITRERLFPSCIWHF